MGNGIGLLAIMGAVLFISMASVSLYIYYGRLYVRARVSGAPVPFQRMFRMTAAGLSPYRVVSAYIDARVSGLDITLDELEQRAREGTDPREFVRDRAAGPRPGDESATA